MRPTRVGCLRSACISLLSLALSVGACGKRERGVVRVFVSNEDSGDVSVIDASTDEVVRTLHVGKRPRGMRVSRDGHFLYVALSGSPRSGPTALRLDPTLAERSADGIAVVDVARGEVVRVLPSGPDPEAFDLSPDERTLYVSNEETAEVTVVDVRTAKALRSIRVGAEPEGVTVRPDGEFVYVTSEASNEVSVIETSTGDVVARIPTELRPRAVAFSADGTKAFVTAELGGALHLFDARRHTDVARIRTGPAGVRPMGVALAPDGAHAYVANGREGTVAIVDVEHRRLERTIANVGARPWGIGVTPDGKKLYVAAGPDLAVVDAARGEVIKRVAVGRSPWGIVVARFAP